MANFFGPLPTLRTNHLSPAPNFMANVPHPEDKKNVAAHTPPGQVLEQPSAKSCYTQQSGGVTRPISGAACWTTGGNQKNTCYRIQVTNIQERKLHLFWVFHIFRFVSEFYFAAYLLVTFTLCNFLCTSRIHDVKKITL